MYTGGPSERSMELHLFLHPPPETSYFHTI